ncbi:MAG: hypothetical protein ACNA8L_08120 [Luteolibacter sp.]|jgi:hypothetical protein
MQLTRFDRWLQKKFIHETHVYTMRELANPPRRVVGYKLPDKPGQRFHFKYVTRLEKDADALIARLHAENMMFNTRMVDRKAWYAGLLSPKGKSLTWTLVSYLFLLCMIASVVAGVAVVWSNPELRQNILDAIEVMKG